MIFNMTTRDMVKLELTSVDIAELLNTISKHSVRLYNLKKIDDFRFHVWIKLSDWELLAQICEKRGDKIQKIKETLFWGNIKNILHRPLLLLVGIILILLMIYVPTRVFFVQVQGNAALSSQEILTAAESCGIKFGASRKNIRSEKIKNELLSKMPELQWAGINTKGCTAVISVKERTDSFPEKKRFVTGIVAGLDGVITSCVLEQGNLLCKAGQVVQKGQLLISGFTDCGLSIQATEAEGEIFANTSRHISVIIPVEYQKKVSSSMSRKKISLLLGKKRINLWKDSGICDTTCDRMYKEYYVMLPAGYRIPLGIAIDTCATSTQEIYIADLDTVKKDVANYANNYISQQMISGVIHGSTEEFEISDKVIHMTGAYVCTEMIGRIQQEKNGE